MRLRGFLVFLQIGEGTVGICLNFQIPLLFRGGEGLPQPPLRLSQVAQHHGQGSQQSIQVNRSRIALRLPKLQCLFPTALRLGDVSALKCGVSAVKPGIRGQAVLLPQCGGQLCPPFGGVLIAPIAGQSVQTGIGPSPLFHVALPLRLLRQFQPEGFRPAIVAPVIGGDSQLNQQKE